MANGQGAHYLKKHTNYMLLYPTVVKKNNYNDHYNLCFVIVE